MGIITTLSGKLQLFATNRLSSGISSMQRPLVIIVLNLTVIGIQSSEDSVGATPAESKSLYDQLLSRHPSTILALNHEVYGAVIPFLAPSFVSPDRFVETTA